MDNSDCDFCDRSVLKKQIVCEGNKVLVVYPLRPVIREHFMIIPTRHVETFKGLSEEELLESAKVVNGIYEAFEKSAGASGFNFFTNAGKKAGQHIPHFHWHLFIRFDDENNSPYKILNDPTLKKEVSLEEWEKRIRSISQLLKDK